MKVCEVCDVNPPQLGPKRHSQHQIISQLRCGFGLGQRSIERLLGAYPKPKLTTQHEFLMSFMSSIVETLEVGCS